ncbi:MAG: nucleoside-diphosphate kinase [Planctomycetota bacterium]|nr:MAG: nucleoside-diphosphate kinase [Planctomycetota bacterium]
METTLVLLKPDALHRGLVGRILSRFEDKGLQFAGMRLLRMTPELAAQHYADHVGKPFYEGLVRFMTASPILALALRGPQAVAIVRKMMGATFGPDADAGTLRGDFGASRSFNLVHGSDSPASAERELKLFFPDGLEDWTPIAQPWMWDSDDA